MYLLLLTYFVLVSILGWIFEYALWKKTSPDGLSLFLFNKDLPVRPLYGFGYLILLFINSYFDTYSITIKVILSTIALSVLECIGGICSYRYHGYQTWKYHSNICYGYVSVYVSLFWALLSFVFFYSNTIQPFKNTQNTSNTDIF
jgi:uncharacterized membrane protein